MRDIEIQIPVEVTLKIPTFVTRYRPTVTGLDKPVACAEVSFNRPINIWNSEVLRLYGRWPHLAVRWSPIPVAIERLWRLFR